MGEIAEMMLDGTLCEGCGEFMGDAVDFRRLCHACANDWRKAGHKIEANGLGGFVDCGVRTPLAEKVKCQTCGKKIKKAGLADHARDVHGLKPNAEVKRAP